MFVTNNNKYIISFNPKDLHKKVGQFVYLESSESDLAEGQFKDQLWFRTIDNELYLVAEYESDFDGAE